MTWRTVSLGDIAERIDYGVTASARGANVGPKFLRITDIQNGSVDWDTVPFCACDERSAFAARLVPGDIVFARTGATTGKSFLIRRCPPDAVFASYLIRLRIRATVDPLYVSHFFRTPEYWRQITKEARGAAQPGVNATKLSAIRLPLPPINAQRRIAQILDKADALRAKRRAALTQVDALNQSVFLDMFGDPAANPHRWPTVALGSVATKFSDGPFGSNLKTEHYCENGVRVIRLQNVGRGAFLDEDAAFISHEHFERLRKHECVPGDVIIATLGEPNLRACILPSSVGPALNKADCVQMRPDRTRANSAFLSALLNLPSTLRLAQKLVHGQTRVRVSMGQLRELRVPLPPIDLQAAFARRLESTGRLKTAAEQSSLTFDALFASLQHRAFRGEL